MAKYDDASWHYEGAYPEDLQTENAATHIGMFLAWCIDNNLISDFQIEEAGDDVKRVKDRSITGAQFLIQNCDEKFTDEDLSDLGNEFTNEYYENDTEFGKQYSSYIQDYSEVFQKKAEAEKLDYPSLYHVEDSWENYSLIKPIIDKRFMEWRQFKSNSNIFGP